MAREVLSNGVINPDKYQADWYADLSNNWNLLNNLIGSAISGSEVDTKIATAIQELMVRTFQIVAELPQTGTEGVMYLVSIPNTSKYTAYVWENNAYRELGVIQMTITIDDELSTTSENPVQNKVITNALGGKASSSHTHSASDITSGLATVATSGSYNDLSNKPTIPTVNDATLTIQQNGTNVQTFTANASANATANIQCVDLSNNQTIAGNKDFTGTTTAHDLVPSATNTYNFGSSTAQWNNAYIKSLTINGVACGDILTHNTSEFVGVSSNQTIGGIKTFSSEVTMFGRDINLMSRLHYGKNSNPSTNTWQYLYFRGNTTTEGYTNTWYGGYLEHYMGTDGTARGRWMIQNTSEDKMGIQLSQSADGSSSSITPIYSNNIDLGTLTNKWKSFNGVNPGALSLPSNSYVNVDTTNWVLDGSSVNIFTPASDGWLGIQATDTVYDQMHYVFVGRNDSSSYHPQNVLSPINALWSGSYHGCMFIPVIKNVRYDIRCICSSITAKFYPCQGNV